MSRLTRGWAALISGLLFAFGFSDLGVDLFAWIALVPLLVAAANRPSRSAFFLGWLSGIVAWFGLIHWITVAMRQFGGMPALLSYAVLLLFATYLGLFTGLFAAGTVFLSRRVGLPVLISAPILWTGLEWIRGWALTGFPWSFLGYSQVENLRLIQIADLTGVYGVSFLIVFVNASLAAAILSLAGSGSLRIAIAGLGSAALLVAACLAYGGFRLGQLEGTDAFKNRTVRVSVIQPNIAQDVKWDPIFRRESLERHLLLTRLVAERSPDLIVWPESATPFILERSPGERRTVEETIRAIGVPVLLGSPADGTKPGTLTNSAYLISTDSAILGKYDKVHLVPFGEYVPLSSLLFFIDKLATGIGDFVPGKGPSLFSLPRSNGENVSMATAICFEVIFPDLVRRFVGSGADLLVTITNDAWFGPSRAPSQHFAMAVFRAVENRISIARAANTGISGFIAPSGRVLSRSAVFVQTTLTHDLSLRSRTTMYTAWGDVLPILCVIMAAAAVFWGLRFGRKTKRPRS